VECLVAIVIVAFGVLAAVQCLNAALLLNQEASRMSLGTALTDQILNDVRSQGVAAYIVTAQANQSATVTTVSGVTTITQPVVTTSTILLNGTQKVVISGFTDGTGSSPKMNNLLNTVQVTVSWTGNRKATESTSITTLISIPQT